MLALLGSAIKAALKDGYLPCPIGWRIAKDVAVPRIVLNAVMDKLGVRIANCQLGFFRVDKTLQLDTAEQKPSPEMTAALNGLDAAVSLTCSTAFELARLLTPVKVSEAVSALGLKIRSCQLSCF
jgi:hypothetical protein